MDNRFRYHVIFFAGSQVGVWERYLTFQKKWMTCGEASVHEWMQWWKEPYLNEIFSSSCSNFYLNKKITIFYSNFFQFQFCLRFETNSDSNNFPAHFFDYVNFMSLVCMLTFPLRPLSTFVKRQTIWFFLEKLRELDNFFINLFHMLYNNFEESKQFIQMRK